MADHTHQEKIEFERRVRVTIGPLANPRFQVFARCKDLSIKGVFVATECLLSPGVMVDVAVEVQPNRWLDLRGEVAEAIELDDRRSPAGLVIDFKELTPESSETLLRLVVTDKINALHGLFSEQFPHLRGKVSPQDLALVVNFWEEHREALMREAQKKPAFSSPISLGEGVRKVRPAANTNT